MKNTCGLCKRKYEPARKEPVTTSGWYAADDGGMFRISWNNGRHHTIRALCPSCVPFLTAYELVLLTIQPGCDTAPEVRREVAYQLKYREGSDRPTDEQLEHVLTTFGYPKVVKSFAEQGTELMHQLLAAARTEDMKGNFSNARRLERLAKDCESLDPVYQQTRDPVATVAKARAALKKIAERHS